MKHLYDTLAVSEITRRDTYSLHPFLEADHLSPQLLVSIEAAGVLTPPVVIACEKEGYEAVTGRQRLRCIEKLEENGTCLCRILPFSTVPQEILAIIIEDQAAGGELTVIEQARFLTLCDKLMPERTQCESFLEGLRHHFTKGSRFLRPLAALDCAVQRRIHEQKVSEKVAAELVKLSAADRMRFIAIVERFAVGGNRQKNLLSRLIDISRREDMTISALLETLDTEELLESDMTRGQKLQHLLDEVEQRHQPLYHQARKSFTEEIGRLNLPESYSVDASLSFERDDVTLAIRFDTLDQLKKSLPALRSIQTHSTKR